MVAVHVQQPLLDERSVGRVLFVIVLQVDLPVNQHRRRRQTARSRTDKPATAGADVASATLPLSTSSLAGPDPKLRCLA